MITLEDAERLAQRWALGAAGLRDYVLTPMVREFDLGFVIWLKEPPSVMPEPGDGVRTVLDRQSGALTQFPSLPVDQVMEMYRQQVTGRPTPLPHTMDQVAQAHRSARRGDAPTVAAHLTLVTDRRLRRSFGAKGDQDLNHHDAVRGWLAAQEPGSLVRGVERHAELIVTSDLLHEIDHLAATRGLLPASMAIAGGRLSQRAAVMEFYHVREQADGLGSTPTSPCTSCADALSYLGRDMGSPASAAVGAPYEIVFAPSMSGLPDALADVLRPPVESAIDQTAIWESMRGGLIQAGHPALDSARDVCLRYGGLHWLASRVGADVRVRPFRIGFDVRPCPEALASFGEVLGTRLAPIGSEGLDESILAVDEQGRIFALDQGGEWFLGADIDTALVNLIFGYPQPRVRDDATWDGGTW
jgi:hypothetical protein